MTREKIAEWGSLFLAVFSVALVLQFAAAGDMDVVQWMGAVVGVLGSVTAALAVRVWREPAAQGE